VVREMAPDMKAHLWGYNGQSPGPTIEVVEGDRVRIFVTNRLPEITTIHWHGQRLPNGMDGVSGLTQPPIQPGKTWVYEFVAQRPGTFMYHPHADEMTQMAMGMMGLWITHPKGKHPLIDEVQRDFCFLLNAYDIDPGSYTPKTMTMLDFNLWSWNSRIFPGIDPLVVRQGDKVRIRVGNLTMTNHPIHLHGHEFMVTGTDGGPIPHTARWPEVTTDIAVGQMRQFEFVADAEGDWAFHCHKSHHTMNAMGHDVPNLIGVEHAPQHRAHDGGRRAPWLTGHGRHVLRAQSSQRPEAGRLHRPRLVPATGRHSGLRMAGGSAQPARSAVRRRQARRRGGAGPKTARPFALISAKVRSNSVNLETDPGAYP